MLSKESTFFSAVTFFIGPNRAWNGLQFINYFLLLRTRKHQEVSEWCGRVIHGQLKTIFNFTMNLFTQNKRFHNSKLIFHEQYVVDSSLICASFSDISCSYLKSWPVHWSKSHQCQLKMLPVYLFFKGNCNWKLHSNFLSCWRNQLCQVSSVNLSV